MGRPGRVIPTCMKADSFRSLSADERGIGPMNDPQRRLVLGRLWDEHDVIAQVAQALDQPGGGALARDLIKVALSEVTEGLAGGEHVEGGDEQLVSHGHESPHGPAAATQSVILVTIVAAFGPHRSRGSGEQYRLQEHVAPAHGRSLRLAGALVVSR